MNKRCVTASSLFSKYPRRRLRQIQLFLDLDFGAGSITNIVDSALG